MSELTTLNYVNLRQGRFDSTTADDLSALFQKYADSANKDTLVLHFHGGLVPESAGMEIASNLLVQYESAGAYPVFFVWESGLWDVLPRALQSIYQESFFQRLTELVTEFTLQKLRAEAPEALAGRGAESLQPEGVRRELLRARRGAEALEAEHAEPFADVEPSRLPADAEMNAEEVAHFAAKLRGDEEFMASVNAAVNELRGAGRRDGAESLSGSSTGARGGRTLMSLETVRKRGADEADVRRVLGDEVRDNAGPRDGAESLTALVSAPLLVIKAVTTAVRVVQRFAASRDHGLYPTIAEEVLRGFYLDNVGKSIWDRIKNDTVAAFDEHPDSGGRALLQMLGEYLNETGARPRIVLVGHSTGAIYISHLLRHARAILPEDVTFEVIFLAPASDFGLFARTLEEDGDRITSLRLFGMSDALERADNMVPVVYPRSLLYFVSGVLEDEADKPIIGMERYLTDEETYQDQDVRRVREYLRAGELRAIWARCDEPEGCRTRSAAHGAFDNEEHTIASLVHMLKNRAV